MYRPVLVTPPAIAPVSLPEAKQQVREEAAGADSDAVLTAYRDAAVGYLDGWSGILGRCLISQTCGRISTALRAACGCRCFPSSASPR